MHILKAGFGVNVGYDFARLNEDTPFEIDEKATRGSHVYGWIAGNPNHKLGFMRAKRIRVQTIMQALKQD